MPVFNVYFTYTVFKRLADDSQQKVERPIASQVGVVADTPLAAIAIAARGVPASFDDETLSAATVTVVAQKTS